MQSVLGKYVEEVKARIKFDIDKLVLRPPLDDLSELRDALGKAGVVEDVADRLYSDFDGQDGGIGIFGEFILLPSRKVLSFWKERYSQNNLIDIIVLDPKIKAGSGWRQGWIPFAWDVDSNSLLVLDYEPSDSGLAGQVFLFPGSDPPKEVLACSLEEFVAWYRGKLAQTNFEIDEEWGSLCRIVELN